MAAPTGVNIGRLVSKHSLVFSAVFSGRVSNIVNLHPKQIEHRSFAGTRCLSTYYLCNQSARTDRKFNRIKHPCGLLPLTLTSLSRLSTSPPETANQHSLNAKAQERLGHVMQLYEDFVGLTEVKEAQNKVVSAEQKFLQVQEDRRSMQADLLSVQADVRAVSAELEKTSRTDSRYIDLVKREHEALLVEKDMSTKIKSLDKAERDFFSLLSAALRESHEKERSRAEKTKYWSIIGSIIGAIIGIIGSTVNNMRRMKELRSIVSESGENTAEYKALVTKTLQSADDQCAKMENFLESLIVTNGLEKLSDTDQPTLSRSIFSEDLMKHTGTIIEVLEKQSNSLTSQLQEIYKVLGVSCAKEDISHVIYAGPELESLISKTEENLQKNIRKNMVLTTVAVSSVVTLSVGLLAFILKGGS